MAALIESFDRILSTGVKVTVQESSITETWQAVASAPIFDPYDELAQFIPALLSPNQQHPSLKLVGVSFPEQDTRVPNVQMVIQRYSNRVQFGDGMAQNGQEFALQTNPLKEPAYIESGFWTTTKNFISDLDGQPFCTTAGEEILHSEEVEYDMWTIEKKVAKLPAALDTLNKMLINDDKVKFQGNTWPKHSLLIRQIKLSKIGEKNGFFFHNLTFVMMYNPDSWLVKKRNAGFISLQPVLIQSPNPLLKKYILKPAPIKVGDPPQYPNRPMPIQNKPKKTDYAGWPDVHGMVFPEFVARDPNGAPTGFTDQALVTPQRLKDIWDETVLTFRTKVAIKFTGNVPLQ